VRSEYDGFFLFEGVPYGRYTVRVGKLSAEAVRIAPMVGSVVVTGAEPSAHLGTVAPQSLIQQASQP
jgi:hypothetical protein